MLQKIKMMGPGIMFAGMAAGMTHVVLMPAVANFVAAGQDRKCKGGI